MDRSRSDRSGSSDQADRAKGKEIPQTTWQDVRDERNKKDAKIWLEEQRTKNQPQADFEKGLLNREVLKDYLENVCDYKDEWREHTNSSSEHQERYREITCLARLTEKPVSNDSLLSRMDYASREINSYSGYEHDYELQGGSSTGAEHRKNYREARDMFLKQNADRLGLKHFASECAERRDEIANLTDKVPQGAKHPLLIKMKNKNISIENYHHSLNAFGTYIDAPRSQVEKLVREYKELRDQFKSEFGE